MFLMFLRADGAQDARGALHRLVILSNWSPTQVLRGRVLKSSSRFGAVMHSTADVFGDIL